MPLSELAASLPRMCLLVLLCAVIPHDDAQGIIQGVWKTSTMSATGLGRVKTVLKEISSEHFRSRNVKLSRAGIGVRFDWPRFFDAISRRLTPTHALPPPSVDAPMMPFAGAGESTDAFLGMAATHLSAILFFAKCRNFLPPFHR